MGRRQAMNGGGGRRSSGMGFIFWVHELNGATRSHAGPGATKPLNLTQ